MEIGVINLKRNLVLFCKFNIYLFQYLVIRFQVRIFLNFLYMYLEIKECIQQYRLKQ